MITRNTRIRIAVLLAATAVALTGCASAAPASPHGTSGTDARAVSISDAWVKAADAGMSAAFGTLVNASDADVTVVSATTKASSMVELHETVSNDAGEMVMRQKKGGFVVPAHGSVALEPGGNHIMLMGLAAPLTAGSEASFTLTFADDTTYSFTAPVKDYAGANENYTGGHK